MIADGGGGEETRDRVRFARMIAIEYGCTRVARLERKLRVRGILGSE
jgi:hypothetical protein